VDPTVPILLLVLTPDPFSSQSLRKIIWIIPRFGLCAVFISFKCISYTRNKITIIIFILAKVNLEYCKGSSVNGKLKMNISQLLKYQDKVIGILHAWSTALPLRDGAVLVFASCQGFICTPPHGGGVHPHNTEPTPPQTAAQNADVF